MAEIVCGRGMNRGGKMRDQRSRPECYLPMLPQSARQCTSPPSRSATQTPSHNARKHTTRKIEQSSDRPHVVEGWADGNPMKSTRGDDRNLKLTRDDLKLTRFCRRQERGRTRQVHSGTNAHTHIHARTQARAQRRIRTHHFTETTPHEHAPLQMP